MARRAKQRDLTFYLLKPQIVDFISAISDRDGVESFPLGAPQGLPFEGLLLVDRQRVTPPWWREFLRGAAPDIPNISNSSTAAVLMVRTAGRIFAVTFGYGRNLLALDAFERDFGLRVALNVIDPDTLRSVDARTFEELTVMTRSQTSRASALENFRISRAEDILKAVTGTPRDRALGTRITGADAVKLTFAPELNRLAEKSEALLIAHGSDNYKERFAFIDQIRSVRDPEKVKQLEAEVIDRLNSRDFGSLHLAPPEAVDLQDVDMFVYAAKSNERFSDLDVHHYCEIAGAKEVTVESLRRSKVGVTYRGADEPHFRWSAYDCLVAEIQEPGRNFVLSGGTWYEIASEFSVHVGNRAADRVRRAVPLPDAREDENELQYNTRASLEGDFHLLDRKLVVPPGARSSIEFCDLLTSDRKLVHVKRRSRSSTLSHLFSQGVVSAEAFLRDGDFRRALVEKLNEEGLTAAAALVPGDQPLPREWEIVFAVIGGSNANWPRSLPFFSQLNFNIAADRLAGPGYNVSLTHIPVRDAKAAQ